MITYICLISSNARGNGSRGSIVNIASICGIVGHPELSAYTAAKHGVVGLTKSAAAEHASNAIRMSVAQFGGSPSESLTEKQKCCLSGMDRHAPDCHS
jgi:NAD(P)-dependent dehydrogenase (short-subunit alcohol dehydrogenase family)